MSFATAFSQANPALPVNKPDTAPTVQADPVKLSKINDEKTKAYEALKDSVSESLDAIGAVTKVKLNKVSNTLLITNKNLKNVESTSKDVQRIERVYRIDTSSRPVVITVIMPPPSPVKKRGFFHWRD